MEIPIGYGRPDVAASGADVARTGRLTHPKYRPDIDGLRAVAVLSVVAFHAFPGWFRGGFIGVDIFFVISGFLISTIILESLQRNKFSLAEFYSRRIRRIFPALLIVLAVMFAFGWFTLFPDEYGQLGKHMAGGAAFVSNFVLWSESGYFDDAADTKTLLHLWSLGIEEQFYIVYPLLVWIVYRTRFNFLAVTSAIAIASFGLGAWLSKSEPVAAFYSPQTRIWELMLGSMLAYVTLHRSRLFGAAWFRDGFVPKLGGAQREGTRAIVAGDIRSALGVALLVAGLVAISKETPFPGWWALLPTLGAVLLISGGPGAWVNRRLLSHPVMVWFGLISFPLYLWHWPVLAFARIIEGGLPEREIRLAAVVVATGLAWVTYEYVEKPFRFGKHAAAKVLVLVVGMLLVGALGYYTLRHKGLEQREWTLAAARANAQFVGASWKYATNDTCLAQYPFAEAPKLEWWFCMKSSESPPTLLLLGTSLANQSYPGIIQNQNLQHHSVLSIGTCDPALDTNPSEGGPCFGERQVRQRRFIDGIVERSPSIRFVLVDGVKRQADSRYIDLLRARLDFLQQNGRKVIVFVPPLAPRFEPKACFSRPFKAAKDCSFPSSNRERLQREFEPLRQAIATSNPAVLFFDPNEIYCENGSCSYIKDGMPLYRDPNHLSEFGSALLFKHFVGWARVHAPGILGEN